MTSECIRRSFVLQNELHERKQQHRLFYKTKPEEERDRRQSEPFSAVYEPTLKEEESMMLHELNAAEDRLQEQADIVRLNAQENALETNDSDVLRDLRSKEDRLCAARDAEYIQLLQDREDELELIVDLLCREAELCAERDKELLFQLPLLEDELNDRAIVWSEEETQRTLLVQRCLASSVIEDVWRVRETLENLQDTDLDLFEEL